MVTHEEVARPELARMVLGRGRQHCRCTGYAPIVKAIRETGTV